MNAIQAGRAYNMFVYGLSICEIVAVFLADPLTQPHEVDALKVEGAIRRHARRLTRWRSR